MIDRQPCLCLPLMHHLVQHRMLYLGPGMPVDMSPADHNLVGLAGLEVDGELTQAALHSVRDPDRYLAQGAGKVSGVQLSMTALKLSDEANVSSTSPPASPGSLQRRSKGMNREGEKFLLGISSDRAGHSRIEKPHHCLQHTVRRERVALMDPKDAPTQAQHHGLIRMGENALYILETQLL
jgi:hypothetical protein